ncbi:hypothetical protein [Streptomyces sp. RP5T]|uniref:hypothetical protein n=1 Tax=Streptomyces sp. RP5T TaxID=2490848 RepID=UPI000F649B70|nr:hypothetical protein [Streptomyces sp. RP5T]RRR79401.1 hypothetical protein EHS43_23995 [Streptomyces sp. RP5T]
MLPAAQLASRPLNVKVGADFDIVVLPEEQARKAVDALAHCRPHPIGAAMARRSEWVLFLPPGSGLGAQWPTPARHFDSGTLQVPPLLTVCEEPRWVRLGNTVHGGRAYTAPLVLHPLLPLLG